LCVEDAFEASGARIVVEGAFHPLSGLLDRKEITTCLIKSINRRRKFGRQLGF
jgi:hypothetical protein